ncbi:MAG: K(+)-stimulated pyrophosphate-energized sodium pump [Hyphomonadaceae bacterium]|nr:MAG: K(+)-stimulated pyrophosphate-energized sodium pump [Hyphomonadaceae bacterium]KAF0185881.1 MAG: K(+)-stimulated pyrophosphate-energized sodium pump [Hyphomonadaceae bacterium]
MSEETKSDTGSLHWPVAIVLAVVLAFLWFKGYGPFCDNCKAPVEVAAAANPPVAEPIVNGIVLPPGPDLVDGGTAIGAIPAAKIYFGVGATAAPDSTNETLSEIVAYLKANPNAKAQISGFHDPSGDPAINAEIAKKRAEAVSAVLASASIAADRVALNKPQSTTGTGNFAEARRVEVSVSN